MTKSASALTALLHRYNDGDAAAFEKLLSLVQDELHRLAAAHLQRERRGHTLQPTALVNEAFLTIMAQKELAFENRSHFFAIASLAMRRVLIHHARKRKAAKRGGGWLRVTYDEGVEGGLYHAGVDVLELDRALTELEAVNERQAKIVELRYFSGLSIDETAQALGLSPRTVNREWVMARAWLLRRLSEE